MISLCSASPDLVSAPVEAWAEWYFGRPKRFDFESEVVEFWELVELADETTEPQVAEAVLRRIAELHERYPEWSRQYSADALSRGLWTMFSHPCWFRELFFAEELDQRLQIRALRSLVVPYQSYVAGWNPGEPMPHGWWMLWDLVLAHTHPTGKLADTALECLEEILAIRDPRCPIYALHGLNHLDHPRRPAVVQRWLDQHAHDPLLDRKWVEQCRDGSAM